MNPLSASPSEKARNFFGADFQSAQEEGLRRTFGSWKSMLERCFVPQDSARIYYKDRGITVCERWFLFSNFVADMGLRPDGLTLDRINNNGMYEPGNCRWADWTTQSRNTSRNRRHFVNGQLFVQSELAQKVLVSSSTIMRRVDRGCSADEILQSTPLWRTKLTASQVLEIRSLCMQKVTDCEIARKFGVTHTNVRQIRLRNTWKHI